MSPRGEELKEHFQDLFCPQFLPQVTWKTKREGRVDVPHLEVSMRLIQCSPGHISPQVQFNKCIVCSECLSYRQRSVIRKSIIRKIQRLEGTVCLRNENECYIKALNHFAVKELFAYCLPLSDQRPYCFNETKGTNLHRIEFHSLRISLVPKYGRQDVRQKRSIWSFDVNMQLTRRLSETFYVVIYEVCAYHTQETIFQCQGNICLIKHFFWTKNVDLLSQPERV